MKACTRCRIKKEDSCFRERQDKRGLYKYLNNTCRECDNELAKAYYDKKRNDPDFKEKARKRTKDYTIKNREHVLQYAKDKKKTPEWKEYMRQWREKNKQNNVAGNKKRNTKWQKTLGDSYVLYRMRACGAFIPDSEPERTIAITLHKAGIIAYRIKHLKQ